MSPDKDIVECKPDDCHANKTVTDAVTEMKKLGEEISALGKIVQNTNTKQEVLAAVMENTASTVKESNEKSDKKFEKLFDRLGATEQVTAVQEEMKADKTYVDKEIADIKVAMTSKLTAKNIVVGLSGLSIGIGVILTIVKLAM
jgi:dissimilatory sulfite reductase (desulfoviridin) alpha/beta subunit